MTTKPDITPENVARMRAELRSRCNHSEWDGLWDEAADMLEALAAERDALAADVTTYQGIVRDMTARNEALAARVAELEAERDDAEEWPTNADLLRAEAKLAASEALVERLRVRLDRGMKWCDMMDGPVSKSQFVNGQATAAQQIRAALEGDKP
jgi:uncharacterized coiled-coil DUF342 family protein